MIDIECGKKLPFTQKDITLVGNAIECRICAEQPSRNYLPSTGRIVHYIIPERSANVRVETGVQLGDEITPYYDSMFAKLITYGSTRNEAIETMKRALGQYEIGGIETNILLLESIIRQNCFAEGKLTTGFIKRHYPHGFNSLPLNEASKKAFIIASVVCFLREEMHCYDINQTHRLPRDTQISDLCIKIDNDNYLVEVKEFADNFISVKYNDIIMTAKYNADFTMRTLYGVLDGKHEFAVRIKKGAQGALLMECSGLTAQVKALTTEQMELYSYMPECKCNHDDDVVKAPITGKITKMKVKSGDKVEVGQHLFSIEAMKMENVVVAEKSGIIEAMACKLNEQVIAGTTILKFVKE
jgi:propionyl-CoA carboxylase alpha chain